MIKFLNKGGIDTSDATATADDILNPKTAYADGNKLTGAIMPTYEEQGFILPYTFKSGNRTVVINNLPENNTQHFVMQDWDYNNWYFLMECIDENFSYYKVYNNKWWGYDSSNNRISDNSKYRMYKSNSQNPNVPWYFLQNGNNTDGNWIGAFGGSDTTCYNSDGTIFYEYPKVIELTKLQRLNTLYIDTSKGNIVNGDVLTGKIGYANASKITGTMANNGQLNYTPSTSQQTIPAGYTSGGTVGAVTSAIDSNITQNNIKAGVTILGVQGNLEPDKPDQTKTATPSTSQQVIQPDIGYELASVIINPVTSAIDTNIQAENIKQDVTILGVTGVYKPDALVFSTIAEMQAYENPTEDLYAIVYGTTYVGTYRYDNGSWTQIGTGSESQESMDLLNNVMGTQDEYEGLGGTEEEIIEVFDDILNEGGNE